MRDGQLTALSTEAQPHGDVNEVAAPSLQGAQGWWLFDDCGSERTDLSDQAVHKHTAFRSVHAACVPGVAGQAIAIDEPDDVVYVPDQPSFTFEGGLTVAVWVKPNRLDGIRTIFRKRERGTSTFVLLSNGPDYQLVIRLDSGRAAAVTARAVLNRFSQVAGTYDGRDLSLYIDGVLAAQTEVEGRLSSGAGPLLMGNDGSGRRIDGVLDAAFFDTRPATPAQIVRLGCLARPSTLVATPPRAPAVPPGTEVTYDVQLTNHGCDPQSFRLEAAAVSPDLLLAGTLESAPIAPEATTHLALTVSSSLGAAPGDFPIGLSATASSPTTAAEVLSGSVIYSLARPCVVRDDQELEVRDVSVVDDPVRTGPGGAWTFGKLMEGIAPTPEAAPAMVEAMLRTWLSDQSVSGFTVAARPLMQSLVLTPFPRSPDGALDLRHAPFLLLAIANRIDLQNPADGTAGEGRFVFGLLDQFGGPQEFTLIVEYRIPAATAQDVTDLAIAWHGLSDLPFPSESYNAALQAVTERFTRRNAAPGRVNDSALGQVRTNDFFTLDEWEFREFHLSAVSGQLAPAPVALTPDASLNNTDALAAYINANQDAILQERHTVPATFAGQPFLGGSLITDFFVWDAPGVDPEARERFARNTCNGCHSSPFETNTFVFQVQPRAPGHASALSPFLTGTQLFDSFARTTRTFNELARRHEVLRALVCPQP